MAKKFCLLAVLLIGFVLGANAQVTGTCTDLNIEAKIIRCMRSGDKCILDGVIENLGAKDILWYIGSWNLNTVVFDDMGNQYCIEKATVANVDEANRGTFPSQIPIKLRMVVENVSDIATEFRRVDLLMNLNDGYDRDRIRFENIPIVEGRASVARTSKSSTTSSSSSSETTIVEDVEGLVNSVNDLVNLFKKKKK